jgi:parvulin-like peptidyl-prolyl isomerase
MKLKAFIFYAAVLILIGIGVTWIVLTTYKSENEEDGEILDPPVYASVNQKEISAEDVNYHLNLMRLRNPEVTQKAALDDLILQTLFEGEAARRGVTVSADEIDERVVEYSPRGLESLEKQLEENNLTMDDFRKVIRSILLKEKLDASIRRELEQKLEIGEEEIKAYYDSHKKTDTEFTNAEIAYIYIMIRRLDEEAEAEAKALAEEIIGKLDEGAVFEDLAREYSNDRNTKNQGGYIGDYRKVSTALQYETLNLEPGRHSRKPIKTLNGYNIIKCLNKRTVPLKQVEEEIQRVLKEEKVRAAMQEFYTSLRENADVVINIP